MNQKEIIEKGKKVIEMERYELSRVIENMDENFAKAVDMIVNCKGKVLLTGTGKSGLIARKISATLSCTDIPSYFLNAYECENGDIGSVEKDDIIIAISNSGETGILKHLVVPSAKSKGTKFIALTGNVNSSLAKESEAVLYIGVEKEACPLGINASTSTTNTLAMGDALALVCMEIIGTTREQMLFNHQGGAWGDALKKEFKKN